MNELTEITEPMDETWRTDPGRTEVFQRWMESLQSGAVRRAKIYESDTLARLKDKN